MLTLDKPSQNWIELQGTQQVLEHWSARERKSQAFSVRMLLVKETSVFHLLINPYQQCGGKRWWNKGINYPAEEVSSALKANAERWEMQGQRGALGQSTAKNRGLEKEVDSDIFPVVENDK